MATKVNFYLSDNLINPPKNWQELKIELNFDKDSNNFKSQVSINEWNLVREGATDVNTYIEQGLTNGTGIFEGMPFRIEIDRGGVIEKPFIGYLDLPEDSEISCNSITAVAKESSKIDWINDVADSFTFAYLESIAKILPTDYTFIPYVNSSVPNNRDIFLSLITIITVEIQVGQAVENVLELTLEAANPFEATAIARIVIFISYLVILLATLVKLIADFIQLIIQPVKYHACMSFKKHLEIGAAHLGLTFSSPDILDTSPFDKLMILPEKYMIPNNKEDNRIVGYTSSSVEQKGYFKGTFGDLLRAAKTLFNGKLIINDSKELKLVTQSYSETTALYQLPDLEQLFYRTNAYELKSNLLLSFLTDLSDRNTIQEYNGTSVQVITKPLRITNNSLILMKGLETVNIPFALAKTKTDFTTPETIILAFLEVFDALVNTLISGINLLIDAVNAVIDLLNDIIDVLDNFGIDLGFQIPTIDNITPVSLANTIGNRLGMLAIESDSFNVPKLFLIQEGATAQFNKISSANGIFLNAEYVYSAFYKSKSFVPTLANPNANQVIIKTFDKIPFTFKDYEKVKANNYIFDSAGNKAEVVSLNWNIFNQTATATVRFPKLYTNNLKETKFIPNGQ